MEKSQNIGPENREMAEALEKLKKYVADGFVLHGSKNKIEVIKPRQAHDDNRDRKEGNLHGIYATDDVRVAIAKALFDIKDKSRRSWKSSYSINSIKK